MIRVFDREGKQIAWVDVERPYGVLYAENGDMLRLMKPYSRRDSSLFEAVPLEHEKIEQAILIKKRTFFKWPDGRERSLFSFVAYDIPEDFFSWPGVIECKKEYWR